jgi:hypothetical protein
MGGTKQQDPKVFACTTICIFVDLVLDLPLPIMDELEYGLWPVSVPANMAGD